MNLFYKILLFLKSEGATPKPYGLFHLICIGLIILITFLLRKKDSEKSLKRVLGIYAIIGLILEITKQIIWSFSYEDGIATWNYTWYAAPFQLCTTPLYVGIICLFLKEGKLRNALLSFIAYIAILGSIATVIMPDSCFVNDILINIHTMWLHCGSLVISLYLLINKKIKIDKSSLLGALYTFLVFVFIADTLNVFVYESGMLGDETFNMFYISPYFISSLPVFDYLQTHMPYILYLITYIAIISFGGLIIHLIYKLINRKRNH